METLLFYEVKRKFFKNYNISSQLDTNNSKNERQVYQYGKEIALGEIKINKMPIYALFLYSQWEKS